uniref:Putative capsid protein n=1 Tax=viral metagenome TaxID=1070528 RepID=A0A6M3XUP8_9ZZZZ
MPTENKDLREAWVTKADMAMADMNAGGVLVRDQRKRFILVNIKGTAMTERVRVTTLSRESEEIPKMTTFGAQVWYPGTESQALVLAQRSKPAFDKVTLTSQEIVAQVDYPRYVLENQVEGPRFNATLIGYLGVHSRRDIENLIINGNTVTGANTYLRMFNGMIAAAVSNTYAAGAVALLSAPLHLTNLTMPDEYDQQPNLAYFTNKVAWSSYYDELAARGTAMGDTFQAKSVPLPYRGEGVHKVPLFPNNLGVGVNETVVLYLDPKQFIFAWHDQIGTWTEYNGRERVWTVVLTARVAEGYEHEPAVVKTTGILGQ